MDSHDIVEHLNDFIEEGGQTMWDAIGGSLHLRVIGGHNQHTDQDEAVILLLNDAAEDQAQTVLARGDDHIAGILIGGPTQGLHFDDQARLLLDPTEALPVLRAEGTFEAEGIHWRIALIAVKAGEYTADGPESFGEELVQELDTFIEGFAS